MQLTDLWSALRRRWYLVFVAVVCSAGAAFLAVFLVGPTYKAQAAVLLLPPGTTVQQAAPGSADGNPYLSLGSVSQARDVVIRALMASTTHEELCMGTGPSEYQAMLAAMCKSDPAVTYLATPDFTSSAPMILITIEADTPRNAILALGAVADLVPDTLLRLQQDLNLRPKAMINSTPVVVDATPEATHKSQIRAGIVAGAAALGVSLLAIGLVDGLLLGRGSQQRPKRAQISEPEASVSPQRHSEADDPGVADAAPPEPDWGWGEGVDDPPSSGEDRAESEVEREQVAEWSAR